MRMREREITNRSNVEVYRSRDRGIVFLYAWMSIRMPREKVVRSVLQDRAIESEGAIERERKGRGRV